MEKDIQKALSAFHDPYLMKTFAELKTIQSVLVKNGEAEINLVFGYPIFGKKEALTQQLLPLLAPFNLKKVTFHWQTKIDTHVGKPGVGALPNIKNIIAVASGKGGVGKSLMSNHLALALSREGVEVGMLDADIYGPSQPAMLGTNGVRPTIIDKKFVPVRKGGIQSMSMGYLIAQDAAMVWRGPMIGKALQQMLADTQWDNLDYLVVDLPPGTGDIQLTLCQKMPLSGAIIVTTPQEMALYDVRRACEMFVKLDIPILGVIENMSHYECNQCGHHQKIFGRGAGAALAEEFNLTLLGQVPLDINLREKTDAGDAGAFLKNNETYSTLFAEIARKVTAKLALQTKDYSHKFPKIVVKEE